MIDALPLLLGPEGYQISRSVRLRSSASAYFSRTFGTPTNSILWTYSAWIKRGVLSASQFIFYARDSAGTNNRLLINLDSSNALSVYLYRASDGAYPIYLYTTAVFRDPSAWYHVQIAYDSANATTTNRVRIYVNGVLQTISGTVTTTPSTTPSGLAIYPTSSLSGVVNTAVSHDIGRESATPAGYLDGYLTEINFIDGQALDPSSFGETNLVTGVWQPKKYTGTYGTNGFYLNFSDNSNNTATTIGADYSGNGNNWTPNNISVTAGVTYDSMLDVPTQWADGGNGRGNYAVLSPIDNNNGTLSNGNLNLSIPAGVSSSGFGNFAMTAGKWYWEVIPTNGSVFASMIGVSDQSAAATNRSYTTTNGWGYYSNAQTYYNNTPASYGATFTTNDVIGVAYDADTGSLSFYKNGVSQGVAFSTNLFGKPIIPAFFNGTSSNAQTFVANFGQRPFAYTPPTGFKALNTLNLPQPTILKGNQYFDATVYTGSTGTNNIVNSGGMAPDFVWVKSRSQNYPHYLYDAVRGTGAKALSSNSTGVEGADGTSITSFNSNGFTFTGNSGANDPTFSNGYVGWQWKEGPTQGFDIVTYTGNGANRTIAHNLGVAPKMIITKARNDATYGWTTYHVSVGAGACLFLNTTGASNAGINIWNNTAPTSSVFSVGSDLFANQNTTTYVAYLFSEVAGFSKFGSYTGNGSTDGPFVFCGFRPRFILFKKTSATDDWVIYDTARDEYNVASKNLYPNGSFAEDSNTTNRSADILSNGFKLRSSGTFLNGSGATFIFAAFAEHPFKNSLAR